MSARLVDTVALVMLVAAGACFVYGARAVANREDLNGIYWMIVGIALLRATSNLARADRAGG